MLHSVIVDQAAELLGVSRRTVYYRIREGKLTTIRTRNGSQRVLMESILALLRARAARARVADLSSPEVPDRSAPP
jgi:excisionase family DNA binding protein